MRGVLETSNVICTAFTYNTYFASNNDVLFAGLGGKD